MSNNENAGHKKALAIKEFAKVVVETTMIESVLPIAILKISDGFHCVVTIKVDGKNARMILDTAASRTIFDKKRIMKLVKDPVITNNTTKATTAAGETEQQHLDIKTLKLDNLVINDYTATLLDLKELNNSYKTHKHHPIDGIIGADILIEHKALIDLSEKELVF